MIFVAFSFRCPTPAVAAKLMPGPVKKESSKVKTAQLQAFRFDGSRSVRIICQLDICKGKCNPVSESELPVCNESYFVNVSDDVSYRWKQSRILGKKET